MVSRSTSIKGYWPNPHPTPTAVTAKHRATVHHARAQLIHGEWHLRNLFTKLGNNSRRELTNALRGLNFEPAPL